MPVTKIGLRLRTDIVEGYVQMMTNLTGTSDLLIRENADLSVGISLMHILSQISFY